MRKMEMNKHLSVMLVLTMLFSLLPVWSGTVMAVADTSPAALAATINQYFGDTSVWEAVYEDKTVTVKGKTVTEEVYQATQPLELDIAGDVTVIWKAAIAQSESATFSPGSGLINITGSGSFTVAEGGSVSTTKDGSTAIHAEGDKLQVTVDGGEVSTSGTGSGAIYVEGNDNKVTVVDGKISTSGKPSIAIYLSGNNSQVTVNGGEISTSGGGENGMHAYAINTTGQVMVNGGKVSTNGSQSVTIFAEGDVTVEGGTIAADESDRAIISGGGNITVEGGTITVDGSEGIAITTFSSNGKVTVSGGTITAKGNPGAAIAASNVKVEGGTITAEGESGVAISAVNVTVDGGTIAAKGSKGSAIVAENQVKVNGGSIYGGTHKLTRGSSGEPIIAPLQPINADGATLYLVTLNGLPTNAAIKDLSQPTDYRIQDVKTDETGKLYFYLPAGEIGISLTVGEREETFIGSLHVQDNNNNQVAMKGEVTVFPTPTHGKIGTTPVTGLILHPEKITGAGISGTVSYNPNTKTLTLNNATIESDTQIDSAIEFYDDLTVHLIGTNRLGKAPADPLNANAYDFINGISAPGKSVTITGDGSLEIYNGSAGIVAENVTIDTTGTITVKERGDGGKACALKADGGTLTINRGTLNLFSYFSNNLYGDAIVINGGTITAETKGRGEGAEHKYAFSNAPIFGSGYSYKVTAGNDASSAREIANPSDATFTKSLYVKIEPKTGTGGSGGSGGDGGSGGGTPPATVPGAVVGADQAAKTVADAIKASKEPVIVIDDKSKGAVLGGSDLLANQQQGKALLLENRGQQLVLSPQLVKQLNEQSGLKAESKAEIVFTPSVGNVSQQTAENLKRVDPLNEQLLGQRQQIGIEIDGQPIGRTSQPMRVTVDVSEWKLTDGQKANFTGAIYNADGKITQQLGGEFSADGKTFTYYTYQPGDHGVIVSGNLNKLQLQVGNQAYTVNGEQKSNDVSPVIEEGRTLLPLRSIAEALEAAVEWNSETKTVAITKNDKTVYVIIGEELANGMGKAEIRDNRTFVPIRYIAEQLGANVVWDGEAKQVYIYQ